MLILMVLNKCEAAVDGFPLAHLLSLVTASMCLAALVALILTIVCGFCLCVQLGGGVGWSVVVIPGGGRV
jgi:hypothetical protein